MRIIRKLTDCNCVTQTVKRNFAFEYDYKKKEILVCCY